eukprot:3516732-Alexandrium_andersonii.AAC.1
MVARRGRIHGDASGHDRDRGLTAPKEAPRGPARRAHLGALDLLLGDGHRRACPGARRRPRCKRRRP